MSFAKAITLEIPLWAKNTLLVVGSSLLLGLLAHFTIPLPFTPVPIVLQSSFVLLLGVLLGSKRAPAAVALFLAQGAFGLPVFAAGAAGLARFAGPTGGYLIGYLIAAYVVGRIVEASKERTIVNAFLAMLAGNAIQFIAGALWLSTFVGMSQAILLGVVPFVIGDLVKMALGLKVLQWCKWEKQGA